jgi:ribosomal protein S27AE
MNRRILKHEPAVLKINRSMFLNGHSGVKQDDDATNVLATNSITCPTCGMTSYNINDVEQRYCGKCHCFY